MMYFTNGRHFIIVPNEDVTEEMKNNVKHSYDLKDHALRTNVADTKTLFKVKQPISTVFNGYKWYNQRDILVELAKEEWNFGV